MTSANVWRNILKEQQKKTEKLINEFYKEEAEKKSKIKKRF